MKPVLAAVLLASALTGCGTTEDGAEPTYGDGLGTPENPIPQDGVAYAVKTRIDLALTPTSPSIAVASAGIRGFAQNPAHALLTVTQGVPELGQLFTALSSTLESRLETWINTEVDKALVGTKTVRQFATDIAGFAETSLTSFGIDSTLTFTPTQATHTAKALVFRLAGFEVVIPAGGLKADAIGQSPDLAVMPGGALTLGEHHFGLAFGDHAWQAINLGTAAAFGSELRIALGKALNCRVLADVIATKCVSGVCVGNAPLLTTVCERGLDLLVADLQSKVTSSNLTDVRYLAGTATLVDENGDGLANKIENGTWETSMTVDTTRATFSAFAEGR